MEEEAMENEKFKVGAPVETYICLKRDADQFEIHREDGSGINMNGFLSLLIVNYYRKYKQERNEKTGQIREIIGPWVHSRKKTEELAEQIMEKVVLPAEQVRRGMNPDRLSITPTRETDRIISEIRGKDKHYAQYLSRMFMSYCEEPLYERERIIFRESTDFLVKACKEHKEIVFTTNNNPKLIHHVIPYDLVVGSDEMNNYLLGQEFNSFTERNEPVSYRLCRIIRPDYSDISGTLDSEVVRRLELTKKRNPQYAITEDSDICVKLTPAGQKSYRQIYFAKPEVDRDRIESLEDGCALYHFDAPQDMVFRFVIRFRPGEAEVISPPELRERVYRHFRESVLPYEKE